MRRISDEESGYAVILVISLMIPLVITAAAFSSVMVSHNSHVRSDRDSSLAMMTAETGVDYALWRARDGSLVSAGTQTYHYGTQRWFRIVPTDLHVDGVDNDGDAQIDEADEDVTQVVITGTYRKSVHRLAAYLGAVPLLPTMGAAVTTLDPAVKIELSASSTLSGEDRLLDGSPGTGASIHGLATVLPGTTTYLLSELSTEEQQRVLGTGAAPSLAVHGDPDLPAFVTRCRNVARRVLAAPDYTDLQCGEPAAGQTMFTFREGDLRVVGASHGAGVLVVTGDLVLRDQFRFDGLVVVMGRILQETGEAKIFGALVQGETGQLIKADGTLEVHHSEVAIALANEHAGNFVVFNGWQQLDKN